MLIVVLLAATRGRQVASEVLLAQEVLLALTAAPVSIRYLHLLLFRQMQESLPCSSRLVLRKRAKLSARACSVTECLMIKQTGASAVSIG